MRQVLVVIASLLLLPSADILAHSVQEKASSAPARAEDVATPDTIIAALLDVISGPAGQPRDWNRFRSLFHPGGRLILAARNAQTGDVDTTVMNPEGYIRRSAARLEREGFHEKEIARRTERFGDILHAFSAYESRRRAGDPKPFARGINSIQLCSDGKRWWIVTVLWQPESPDNQLPSQYLRSP